MARDSRPLSDRLSEVPGLARATIAVAASSLTFFAANTSAPATPNTVAGALNAAVAPASQLEPSRTIGLPGGATVYRFQRRVRGVPVLGGEAVVNDPPGAPPRLVSEAGQGATGPPGTPLVSGSEAIRVGRAAVNASTLRAAPSTHLVIAPGPGGALAWDVLIPSVRPLGDFQVLVDARSDAVLQTRNLIRDFRTGKAKIFVPNPVVTNHGDVGLHDKRGRNSKRLNELRVGVRLRRLMAHQHCLKGRFVKVLVGRHEDPVCRRSLNWRRVKRARDTFEALMSYYHVDHEQSYVQSLGFHNVDNRRQVVLADKIGEDNSFYSPITRELTLGTGGVDDGEDADVISHEYGHSIQDNEAPSFLRGNGLEAGSLAEGSADYMATAMSAQDRGTTNTDDICIFDWDAQTWGTLFPALDRHCGRRADNPSTLSEEEANQRDCSNPDPTGPLDIHCVGTVWSSALWDLRRSIGVDGSGRAVIDRDMIASQFMYTGDERFQDAANALLTADQDLYGGTHEAAIEAEMVARGLCPSTGC
jgi:Zn-dependent metalloprotease